MACGVDNELHLHPARDPGTRQNRRVPRLRLRDHLDGIVQLCLEEDLTRNRSGAACDTSPDSALDPLTREVPWVEWLLVQIHRRNVLRDVGWRHHSLKSLWRGVGGNYDIWWGLFRRRLWRLGWLQEDHRRVHRTILDGLSYTLSGFHGSEYDEHVQHKRQDCLPQGALMLLLGFDQVLEHATASDGGLIVPGK